MRKANQLMTGEMMVKTTKSDTPKERIVTLKHKKIELKRTDRVDELEVIDLTKLQELYIDQDDHMTLVLKLSEQTYFLKAYKPEEANCWYFAIKNKQVFGVAIENQERDEKKVR